MQNSTFGECSLAEILNGVFEEFGARTLGGQFGKSRPVGVIGRKEITLWMRHKAKDTSGGIADTGHIARSAVGIVGKRERFVGTCAIRATVA